MSSWSYSAYSAAAKCLQYYKLVYIDKLVPDSLESGDLAFGSAMHSALNSILQGDSGEEIFNLYWDSYKEKEIEYGRFKWQELRELGLNFCSKFSRLQAKKYELESAEIRLYGEYKGIELEGQYDFVGKYNGRTSLRDFKTSGYNYDKSKSDIALQLNLYAYLYLQFGSTKLDTLGYTVLNKGTGSIQDLTWDFDEKKMYEHLDNMVDYCANIEKRTTHPKNPNSCQMGSFKCSMFEKCWGKK